METVIIVIHLMVVLALVGVVLLQRSEGGALGIGGGGGGGFMSARGAANALTRTTAILAAAFFATSIILGVLAKINEGPNTVLERIPTQTEQGGGEGILDQITPPGADSTIPGGEDSEPAAPQVPSGQ
jgi:preprotein translocase subunit SecG